MQSIKHLDMQTGYCVQWTLEQYYSNDFYTSQFHLEIYLDQNVDNLVSTTSCKFELKMQLEIHKHSEFMSKLSSNLFFWRRRNEHLCLIQYLQNTAPCRC